MRIALINTDWMHYYMGGTGKNQVELLCGHNYQYINGKYYAYGEGLDSIEIDNFQDISKQDDYADKVLVVWTAKNNEGKTILVGWYQDAVVFRKSRSVLTLDSERVIMTYSIVAEAKKATLLPLEERNFEISESEEKIRYYGEELETKELLAYINGYRGEKLNLVLSKEELENTVSITLDDEEQYLIKANDFQNKGLYAKAIKWCNKGISEKPEAPLAYECKGSILLSLKMYDEALKAYLKVIELEKDNIMAIYCLGLIYGLKEDYQTCIHYLDKYLHYRKKDANALAEKGIAFYRLGQREEAKKLFSAANKLDKENELYKRLLAME